MTTQAELWVRWLKIRTDNAPALSQGAVKQILDELHGDYPHKVILLTDNGEVVGTRRVFFADRSYAQQMMSDQGQKITVGTMTGGAIGTAHNGRVIDKLQ